MSDITDWIQEAGVELSHPFLRCDAAIASRITRLAKSKFVEGNPRVWWLSLSRPFATHDSSSLTFADVLPARADRVWFIPEDDSKELPLYDLSPDDIELIRKNCPLFEYYALDKDFRWLVIETDHDRFVVCME